MCLYTFVCGSLGFLSLIYINKTNYKLLRKLFTVPARKSTTDAIQLGGLPLSFAMLTGTAFSLYFLSDTFTSLDKSIFTYWLYASLIVIAYGHLDDKYELRPIVKLCMQVSSVILFSLPVSQVIYPSWSAVSFLVLGFWGMGSLNGGNLLDGLDTLTIKLGSVSMCAFLALGFLFDSTAVMSTSLIGLSGLFSFYYFNKEPAKVHLGEIGGSFIGFFSLLNSCLLFVRLQNTEMHFTKSVTVSLLPLCLPLVELGVSFMRRIYNRKSPFKGDKYHLHHILRNYYKYTPSYSSSVFALGYASIIFSGIAFLHYSSYFETFLFVNVTMISTYVLIGRKHWKGQNTINLNPTSLFQYLMKKDVAVINSLEFDEFKLEIISESEAREEEDLDLISEDSDTHKKAA
jgi:UDP-N-acetylmuramyl pentapeptide phosphotransferase/UDP-N-acetylglucosamine-1-phosphate transferase